MRMGFKGFDDKITNTEQKHSQRIHCWKFAEKGTEYSKSVLFILALFKAAFSISNYTYNMERKDV
jgi:hypothetical protein